MISPAEKVAFGSWVLLMLVSLFSSLRQVSRNWEHGERRRGWVALSAACGVWIVAGVLALTGTGLFTDIQRVGTLIAIFGVYFLWRASRSS
ncbi:MAG TPA: hypothetical protein VGN26_10460 [Armatimonadota bacterium]|jgi:hypothetical protein